MLSLDQALILVRSESPMDYCEEFLRVKTILEFCNRNVKPFKALSFRSGNESFLIDLSQRLQKMFVERELVSADDFVPRPDSYHILRKVLMFLLVNTDAIYKYNLRNDQSLAHLFKTCPLLPRFVTVALVWELQLDRFFYEVLSFSPGWFTFHYFEAASDSLKYIEDPYAVLEKVEQLVRASYINLKRMELQQMNEVDRKIIYSKLYDNTMNLLRQFYTPDAEKFKNFTKNQLSHYSGYALKHILQMVLFAFDVYEVPSKADPTLNIDMYEICVKQCKLKGARNKSQAESQLLKEQQLQIITALLNSLQYNVMLVTIDVFMYLVEVNVTPTKTLQLVVGEMAFEVVERMRANSTFAHDLETQLEMIAIRPKTLTEIINDATLGDILRSLDEEVASDVKKAWFDGLFRRTVALGNDECLQSIREHIKLMNVENCQQVMEYLKLEIQRKKAAEDREEEDQIEKIERQSPEQQQATQQMGRKEKTELYSDDYEELISLLLLSLNNFNTEQLLQLLTYQSNLFGSASAVCKGRQFESRSTKFLNKLSVDSIFNIKQFLMLCFQNATRMWSKFFDTASYSNGFIINFCDIVQQTAPYSNGYLSSLLSQAMRNPAKLQDKLFPELLCEIYFVSYFPARAMEFLEQIVNENVSALLEAQQFEPLLSIMKALNLISMHGETCACKVLNFGDMTAPVLVMVAQIMDTCRWDLITYTDERDMILSECVRFVQENSKKFLTVATEKDRKWISKVVKNSYRPLTQFYFQQFALTPDQPPIDFDRFLKHLDIEDKSEAELFLIIHYVRCTMKETEWLARSERLLPHISNVMLILSGVIRETNTANAINNYRHCLANYANIVTKILLPKFEAEPKKFEKLTMKMLKIIASAPEQIYEEIFRRLDWLLLEILRRCTQPLNEEFVENLLSYATSLKHCQAKDIFLEKFQTLTSGTK